jgi:hypothetical protein
MSERARRADGFSLVSRPLEIDGDSENCCIVFVVPLMIGLVGIGRALAALRSARAPIA